jgi:2-dehydropantoate 2-reductase
VKYIFIAAFGLVGAGFNKTLGEMLETPRLSEYVQSVMREITLLAEKKGIVLPENIITESYQRGRDFAYETKTSFQRDFESVGKLDERDLFGGTILRLGEQLGVATPVTQELWEILERRKPWPI